MILLKNKKSITSTTISTTSPITSSISTVTTSPSSSVSPAPSVSVSTAPASIISSCVIRSWTIVIYGRKIIRIKICNFCKPLINIDKVFLINSINLSNFEFNISIIMKQVKILLLLNVLLNL